MGRQTNTRKSCCSMGFKQEIMGIQSAKIKETRELIAAAGQCSKFMIKRCQRLPQVWRDLATHWGWRVKLQLSSNFTMDHVPLQNEALPCRYIILSWKLLPGPGPSKCTWAWADVKIIIITVYYSSIKFWFLSIDGLWLTFYYLLHPDYHEYWQPLTWNTKVKTSGGFANIAQLLHVPGLPVHALGGEKVHRTFAFHNGWTVWGLNLKIRRCW